MKWKPIHVGLVCLSLVALPALALPPNLIKGGSFDTPDDLKRWRLTPHTDWEGIDAQNRAGSGSAAITNREGEMVQCIAISPRKEYDFGARVLLTPGAQRPASPRAYVQLDFLADALCRTSVTPLLSVRTDQVVSPNGRFSQLSARGFSPDGAEGAMLRIVAADPGAPNALVAPTLVDDVFMQELNGCVPDDTTLCLGGGRLAATVTYYDGHERAHQASAVQLSTASGYFYTYSADDAELTIKTNELADGARGFVIGGMTNLRLQINVKDLATGDVKTYFNQPDHFLSPIVGAFPAE